MRMMKTDRGEYEVIDNDCGIDNDIDDIKNAE